MIVVNLGYLLAGMRELHCASCASQDPILWHKQRYDCHMEETHVKSQGTGAAGGPVGVRSGARPAKKKKIATCVQKSFAQASKKPLRLQG